MVKKIIILLLFVNVAFGQTNQHFIPSSPNCDTSHRIANYTALRNYDGCADVLYVTDQRTQGWFIKTDSAITENGGTRIVGFYKWKRDFDQVHYKPEWWEIGGFDWLGYPYTYPELAREGIHNERDAVESCMHAGGPGSVIEFLPNKIYDNWDMTVNSTYQNQTLNGNGALLKFCDNPQIILTSNISIGQTTCTVNSVLGLRVGQNIFFANTNYFGDNNIGPLTAATYPITSILGTTITVGIPFEKAASIGDSLVINRSFFRNGYLNPPKNLDQNLEQFSIKNFIFDGNRNNNTKSYDWRVSTILDLTNHPSRIHIQECRFINTPNECITIGSGIVENCHAETLGGSFVHISAALFSETSYNVFKTSLIIQNNKTYNTNINTNAVMNHSEGVITHSANNENVTIRNNVFVKTNESIFSPFTAQNSFLFENNYCENSKSIFNSSGDGSYNAAKMFCKIINNKFINCGDSYMSSGLLQRNSANRLITIIGNEFLNCRFAIGGIGQGIVSNNKFVYTKFRNFANYSNDIPAIQCEIFDQLKFDNNLIVKDDSIRLSDAFYVPLLPWNVRKDAACADTWTMYAGNSTINGNTIMNFKNSIYFDKDNKTYQQGVGNIEISHNNITMSDSTIGFGIQLITGMVAKSNSVFAQNSGSEYYPMFIRGTAEFPSVNLNLGSICTDNFVYGLPTDAHSIYVAGFNNIIAKNIICRPITGNASADNLITANIEYNTSTFTYYDTPIRRVIQNYLENINCY